MNRLKNYLLKSSKNPLRAIAAHTNAVFPFLYPLKDYFNGFIFIGLYRYICDSLTYIKLSNQSEHSFRYDYKDNIPWLLDRFESAGAVPKHYFWQDLWAAKIVYKLETPMHHDIGSRLDGFIAHCLPFCKITMMDFRALPYKIPNLHFVQTNCMDMNNIPSNSISSLSSLHVVEHFGLGRYGDPVDPIAHVKAISEIQRIISPGGKIIFSVPVGIQRLEFNAQRIFNPKTIIELFDNCNLDEFSVVDDDNNYHEHQNPEKWAHLRNGCGLFLFTKKNN